MGRHIHLLEIFFFVSSAIAFSKISICELTSRFEMQAAYDRRTVANLACSISSNRMPVKFRVYNCSLRSSQDRVSVVGVLVSWKFAVTVSGRAATRPTQLTNSHPYNGTRRLEDMVVYVILNYEGGAVLPS